MSNLVPTLGLDIGGANLKAAHTSGFARTLPFPLWKQPHSLTDQLCRLFQTFPAAGQIALTMTGELCDCYATRKEGVQQILQAVSAALVDFSSPARPADLKVWQTTGHFVDAEAAAANWQATASANWLASACFAARYVPHGPALFVDMGSTTTDFVRMHDGRWLEPLGRTDHERLVRGELLYIGAGRTPLHALVPHFTEHRTGKICSLIPEWFATVADAYVLLGDLAEDPADCETADGRPRTRACARNRLLRAVGWDEACVPAAIAEEWANELASAVRDAQTKMVRERLAALELPPETHIVIAGSGEFVLRPALAEFTPALQVISLAERLGPQLSTAAAAYAVAVLAGESADAAG